MKLFFLKILLFQGKCVTSPKNSVGKCVFMYKRKIETVLKAWIEDSSHKPLGAWNSTSSSVSGASVSLWSAKPPQAMQSLCGLC